MTYIISVWGKKKHPIGARSKILRERESEKRERMKKDGGGMKSHTKK